MHDNNWVITFLRGWMAACPHTFYCCCWCWVFLWNFYLFFGCKGCDEMKHTARGKTTKSVGRQSKLMKEKEHQYECWINIYREMEKRADEVNAMETVTERFFFFPCTVCESKCHVYVGVCKCASLAEMINPPAPKTPRKYHADSCRTCIYSNEKFLLITLFSLQIQCTVTNVYNTCVN